jgi:prefoldin alpha subunit
MTQNKNSEMMNAQLGQMQQIVASLDSQISSISATIGALHGFSSLKGDEDILFPLANGIFAQGKLSGSKTLKVNVGKDVVVEKTIPEAVLLMESQLLDMTNYRDQLMHEMELIINRLNGMEQE